MVEINTSICDDSLKHKVINESIYLPEKKKKNINQRTTWKKKNIGSFAIEQLLSVFDLLPHIRVRQYS